jgi:hypothetical protein
MKAQDTRTTPQEEDLSRIRVEVIGDKFRENTYDQ